MIKSRTSTFAHRAGGSIPESHHPKIVCPCRATQPYASGPLAKNIRAKNTPGWPTPLVDRLCGLDRLPVG